MSTQPVLVPAGVTGYSASFNLREAIDNAVSKLPPSSVPRRVHIASVEAQVGGLSKSDGLYITVEVVKSTT